MKSTTITLGGQEYELKPLPHRPAKAMRQQLADFAGDLFQTAGSAPKVELENADALASLAQKVGKLAIGSVDQIAEWLFDYSPELAADRERIENEAFDDELIAAFLEAIKQLFPFGSLVNSLIGLMDMATSTSSPSPNGAAGRTR